MVLRRFNNSDYFLDFRLYAIKNTETAAANITDMK